MGVISDKKFIKGMDVSSLPELEQLGAKFYDKDGDERNLLAILQVPMQYVSASGTILIPERESLMGRAPMTWKLPWRWQSG